MFYPRPEKYSFRPTALVQIITARVDPQDGFDEFGPLCGGHITLEGNTHPIELGKLRPTDSLQRASDTSSGRFVSFDFRLDFSTTVDDLREAADCCLPIFFEQKWGVGLEVGLGVSVRCLLLKQDNDVRQDGGTRPHPGYTRVGILEVFFKGCSETAMPETPETLRQIREMVREAITGKGKEDFELEETLTLY